MDAETFDRLARSLTAGHSRRRLLSLLAAVPLAGTLAILLGEEAAAKRPGPNRRAQNRRQSGNNKDNRKGKRKGDDQDESKTDPSCGGTPCASGVCCGKDNTCCIAPANQCNQAGLCCAPNCAGRQCGPDGCGGSGTCGSCGTGASCIDQTGQCCKAHLQPCTAASQCCATDHTACAFNNAAIPTTVCCTTLGGGRG